MKIDRRSLTLLILQLLIVSSIAAKYLYQRQTCPRVWTRAVAYDPEMILRGRYLSMQLHIDACGVNLPLARKQSPSPEDGRIYFDPRGDGTISGQLSVALGVRNGRLVADRIVSRLEERNSQDLILRKGQSCSDAALWAPVDFYIPEHASSPFPLTANKYLWVEVTIPPKGPPRPLNLALNDNGHWQLLNYR
jgi:hypothetical protein